jgi:DNA-directed RNA polymerase subunit RPC12/RpoP
MPRLIGFLLVLLAGIGLARWLSHQNQEDNSRNEKTFRPRRPSPFSSSTDSGSSINDIYAMSRSSVSSVCDALTGAPINTHGKVWRCVNCQSLYNNASVVALEKDNDAACVQCSSKSRGVVTFTDD